MVYIVSLPTAWVLFLEVYSNLPLLGHCLQLIVDDYIVVFLVQFWCKSIHCWHRFRLNFQMFMFSSTVFVEVSFLGAWSVMSCIFNCSLVVTDHVYLHGWWWKCIVYIFHFWMVSRFVSVHLLLMFTWVFCAFIPIVQSFTAAFIIGWHFDMLLFMHSDYRLLLICPSDIQSLPTWRVHNREVHQKVLRAVFPYFLLKNFS